jgi:hypothetical protein
VRNHIRPLVDEQRQVAIALDPALERVADDRLGRRPYDQRLLELGCRIDHKLAALVLQAVVGDDRHLLGEAFDVLGLLGDEAHRYEQREIAVLVARILDARVELGLDALPNAPAPRLDHHAAAHRAGLGHVPVTHGSLIPLRKILLARDGERPLAHRLAPNVPATGRGGLGVAERKQQEGRMLGRSSRWRRRVARGACFGFRGPRVRGRCAGW